MAERLQEIEDLLRRSDLRTADAKYLQTMRQQLRKGKGLDYQDEQNLWAYIIRYGAGASQGG